MINPNVDTVAPSQHGMSTKHTVTPPSPINGGIDEDAYQKAQAVSDAINSMSVSHDELTGLTSTEARIHIERKYRPLLSHAVHQHREACDDVTNFEDHAEAFLLNERTRYAVEARHPEIKKLSCAGATHMNHLLTSGALTDGEYKLAEVRPVTLSVDGVNISRSTLILIPNSRLSLLDYAGTEEAKVYAAAVYKRDLQKLINKRKTAAVHLEDLKAVVSELWLNVGNFEDMFSSDIRKGRK